MLPPCFSGNWGPHLIIVPTSVMLNWEMELKRWCPGFKILTYFGSQKERKLKRQVISSPISRKKCSNDHFLVVRLAWHLLNSVLASSETTPALHCVLMYVVPISWRHYHRIVFYTCQQKYSALHHHPTLFLYCKPTWAPLLNLNADQFGCWLIHSADCKLFLHNKVKTLVCVKFTIVGVL